MVCCQADGARGLINREPLLCPIQPWASAGVLVFVGWNTSEEYPAGWAFNDG